MRIGFCTDRWATYTNMVPKMYFAGQSGRGGGRKKFVDFTPREIEKHLSVYIMQGLNKSPSISKKFELPELDPVNGTF